MIAVDFEKQRVLQDAEIIERPHPEAPLPAWCDEHLLNLGRLRGQERAADETAAEPSLSSQLAFGYDSEEHELILTPLAEGLEPTGSMGDDTPLAVLSRRPRLLYQYFKQLFAQVTNPPIDSIREKSVMSLGMYLGGRLGLFEEVPQTSGIVELDSRKSSRSRTSAAASPPRACRSARFRPRPTKRSPSP
jgi:glutamate synthase (ferredoxin)